MKIIRRILKYLGIILLLPVTYFIISLILTYIPVNTAQDTSQQNDAIYLSTNGVHLEIIIPKEVLDPSIAAGLTYDERDMYFSFGWGDRNFYVETPTWADLSLLTGFKALFINTSSLLHVTRYRSIQKDWARIPVNPDQLSKINTYIKNGFRLDASSEKILLPGLGYTKHDDFYEATGNYTCFNTCNTWINTALKQSDIKACLWTPYEFRLLSMHQE